MGIFDRMGRVISSNFNALLDGLDDPRKSIDSLLDGMNDQLLAARREIVSAVAAEKQLKEKVAALDVDVQKWEARAELALKKEDESLAREALADLAKLGVKTTIDLTDRDGDSNEERLAEAAGLKFFKIAMNTRVVPTPEQISTFLSIVNDPANQPVYVHCVGGKHRTGVMTAIYRIVNDAWTADQAYQEMLKYDYYAFPFHGSLKTYVYRYYDDHTRALAKAKESAPAPVANAATSDTSGAIATE